MEPDDQQPDAIVFPCSGASDTGAIADAAARDMSRRGVARMYCLAGVGAKVEQIVSNTAAAERLIALDGCENGCARELLEAAGFTPALHIRLNDLGMEKGNTPPTKERVQEVIDALRRQLEDLG